MRLKEIMSVSNEVATVELNHNGPKIIVVGSHSIIRKLSFPKGVEYSEPFNGQCQVVADEADIDVPPRLLVMSLHSDLKNLSGHMIEETQTPSPNLRGGSPIRRSVWSFSPKPSLLQRTFQSINWCFVLEVLFLVFAFRVLLIYVADLDITSLVIFVLTISTCRRLIYKS